jgi:hypothetical protein
VDQRHARAPRPRAFDLESAPERLGHGAGQKQPQTGPLPGLARRIEGLADAFELRRRDAGTRIGHGQCNPIPRGRRRDLDPRPRRRRPQAVVHDVAQALHACPRKCPDEEFGRHRHVTALRGAEIGDGRRDEIGERKGRRRLARRCTGLEAHAVENAPTSVRLLPDEVDVVTQRRTLPVVEGGQCKLEFPAGDDHRTEGRRELVRGTGGEPGERDEALGTGGALPSGGEFGVPQSQGAHHPLHEVDDEDGRHRERDPHAPQVQSHQLGVRKSGRRLRERRKEERTEPGDGQRHERPGVGRAQNQRRQRELDEVQEVERVDRAAGERQQGRQRADVEDHQAEDGPFARDVALASEAAHGDDVRPCDEAQNRQQHRPRQLEPQGVFRHQHRRELTQDRRPAEAGDPDERERMRARVHDGILRPEASSRPRQS